MSIDISIKPIGLPTATPYIAANDASRGAVPTQLPAQKTVAQAEPAERAHKDTPRFVPPLTNKVIIDEAAAAIVFQTVDDLTAEVIGQYPAEGMLRRRAYIRALDQSKADLPKPMPTDHKA